MFCIALKLNILLTLRDENSSECMIRDCGGEYSERGEEVVIGEQRKVLTEELHNSYHSINVTNLIE
jgi:hypothetical protein